MILEYAENILELSACVIALLLSMFQYISVKKRAWFYLTLFCLSTLLSSYYWTAYLVIMGDWPDVSPWLTYSGWNISFFIMILLLLHMGDKEEKRYFHPLMLLPVPLNIWQLTLYLPYSSIVNNVYQVTACTVIACLGIRGICYRVLKNKKDRKMPFFIVALLFSVFKFGMWTCSCFYAPVGDFYYPFSFLCSADYLFLVWALRKVYRGAENYESSARLRLQHLLKTSCFVIVMFCGFGGVILGMWMRRSITQNLEEATAGHFQMIPVILFVVSMIIVAFAISIILVVYFSHKASQNDELRREKVLAEAASAAKSEFLANMSHEIRTPVNAMMGMNEIVLRESRKLGKEPPEDREKAREAFRDIGVYAGSIARAGESLLSIIDDILDLSRIEAGKIEITPREYRLSSLLDDLNNMMLFRFREKGLAFRIEADETIPDRLLGDEVRVRQIIINLLTNALKYTRQGSVRLSVTKSRQDMPDDKILLTAVVQDTGIGIREEDMGRLFGKFERMDMEKNSTIEGTGLGLAIIRQLLERMDGTISVESVYGKGSTFTVSIPQKAVAPEPIGPYRQHEDISLSEKETERETFTAPDACILVVDDTRMNLMVTEGLLRSTKIRVDTATGGEEALKMTAAIRYDVILMDQRMPVMDGTEALRRIRVQEPGVNNDTPVICMTADAVSGAREKYIASGFTDYLMKPVEGRQLEQILLRYLPAEKVRSAAEPAEPAHGVKSLTGEADRRLREAGIRPETGLRFCGGDETLYLSLLREFATNAEERIPALSKAFAEKDWKNYMIQVHTLKSSAGTIGADELSRTAAGLEKAAKNGDEEAIREAHPRMAALYEALVSVLRSLTAADGKTEAEDEILEFSPEWT